MNNTEFLALAEKIGLIIRAYDRMVSAEYLGNADLLWDTTKMHVNRHLKEAGMTVTQFDERMKPIDILTKCTTSLEKVISLPSRAVAAKIRHPWGWWAK